MNFKAFSTKPQWKSLVTLDIKEKITFPVSIAMQKGSELLALFNHQILRMIETGVLQRMRKKWLVISGKFTSYQMVVNYASRS